MESASSEESFHSALDDGVETSSSSHTETDSEDELFQELTRKIAKTLPNLDEIDKKWILDNFKSFESANQMLQCDECCFLSRKQMKVLEPILEDVIQKHEMQRKMHFLSTEVNCDYSTARWVCENFHDFAEIGEFLERSELDDLTRKQIEALKKVLNQSEFKKTADVMNEKAEMTFLRDRIHEKVRLEKDVCQWIAEFWIQVGSLQELFNNKKLDEITRKQQKDLKQLLQNEFMPKTAINLEDELNEVLGFAEAKTFSVSKSSARKLLEIRGEKYNVPEVVQALIDDGTLDFPSKFELLKFLLCSPDETLEKNLLQKSEQYKMLEVQFETLANHCCLSEELITKLKSSLFNFNAVEDLDHYEDMTLKQNRAMKENLAPHLQRFLELRRSIVNKSEINGDCTSLFFQSSVISKKDDSEQLNQHLVRADKLEEQNCSFMVPPQCSEHPVSPPKGSDAQKTEVNTEKEVGQCNLQSEQSLKIIDQRREKTGQRLKEATRKLEEIQNVSTRNVKTTCTSRNETDNATFKEKVSAHVYPLITCQEISQGDSLVEKFFVRAEYVEQLCNFEQNFQMFYRDVSSGLMIDFVALDEFKISVIGVLGRLKNATNFFANNLDDCSNREFQQILDKEGSGMYFVVSQDVADSKTGKCFLYYYSQNDEDYERANPKSRAVHFFRYITQLTKSIVLLLDDSDYLLLAKAPATPSVKTINRAKKYKIQELELQKEQVVFDNIDTLTVETPVDWQIFSSSVGLYLMQTFEKKAEKQKHSKKKWINGAEEFQESFKLTDLSEDADVCDNFMGEYIYRYHQERFRVLESLWIEKKTRLYEDTSGDFDSTIDFALAMYLYAEKFTLDFQVIEEYLKNQENNIEPELKSLWEKALNSEFDIDNALHPSDKRCLLEDVKIDCSDPSAAKFILKLILEQKTEKKPDGDLSLEDLLRMAEKENILSPRAARIENYNIWGAVKRCFSRRDKALSSAVIENKVFAEHVAAICEENGSSKKQLHMIINKIMKRLLSFKNKISQDRTLLEYIPYKQVKFDRLVDKTMAKEREDTLKQCFLDIFQEEQNKLDSMSESSSVDAGANLDKSEEKLVTEISMARSSRSSYGNYLVCYSIVQEEDRKTQVDVRKLLVRKGDRDLGKEDCMAKSFTFGPKESVFLPSQSSIFHIFPIEAGLALFVVNTDKTSIAFVQNLNTCREIHKINFREKLSACDFDVSKRLLCLYSKMSENAELHLYQFSPDFKNHSSFSSIELKAKYDLQKLQGLCFQYCSKFLWLLEESTGRVMKINSKNGTNCTPEKVVGLKKTVGIIVSIQMTSNGQCALLTNTNKETFSLMTQSCNLLQNPGSTLERTSFFTQHELHQEMAAKIIDAQTLQLQKISILGAQQEIKLQESEKEKISDSLCDVKTSKTNAEHWILNFYWLFVKFPCQEFFGSNEIQNEQISFCVVYPEFAEDFEMIARNMLLQIADKLKATKKPVQLFNGSPSFKCDGDTLEIRDIFYVKMGEFVQSIISFTPLKIARCQTNQFLVLENGDAISLENISDVFDLKEKINLGLFEAVFNHWTGPVKVISSMGKQTTGKSYLLNHLMGSSFNISGTRCTDGCWMTVKVAQGCLYVILDFEGLGSFERTDQDDMLLSLFNSSLSTMTLFKTEQRLDRDTDQLFSKFNLGSDQLKNTDKIFQGQFMIIVKDVAESDVEDIRKEFEEKINGLLHKEKHNNFISKLYRGGFQINPFSPFQTKSFYNDVDLLRQEILSASPLFESGSSFMEMMKLLLAKLAINDFTPIDRQHIDARIKYLRSHMKIALKYGQLCDDDEKHPEFALTLLDKKNERMESKWLFELTNLKSGSIEMSDDQLTFIESSFRSVVGIFNRFVTPNASNLLEWRQELEMFLEACLKNRFQRVCLWMEGNLAAWKNKDSSEYEDSISALRDSLRLEKEELNRQMKFCDQKCSECFVKCTHIHNHVSDHLCSTSHLCTEKCGYCKEEERACKHALGHEGSHVCSEVKHFCGDFCSFHSQNGCPNECSLISNHEGDHFCSLKVHLCNLECSLENCTSFCQMDCNVEHEVHKCAKEQCMADCCVKNCRNLCSAKDHFHGFPHLSNKYRKQHNLDENEAPFVLSDGAQIFSDEHFCGNEHSCGQDCEEEGYCEVSVEKQFEEKEEVFEGQRSTFTYKRKFAQVGKKLPCLQKIKAFEKSHSGDHSCTTRAKIHFCTEVCPTCENICDKPFNHTATEDRLHHTSHGNMTKCHFICNQEDFNVGEHKYVVGEQAVAEFCHLFCNSLGRGHVHVLECPGQCQDYFEAEHDHRRHETCKYGPNEDVPKDEIWHSAYWEHIGFQDPCTGAELEVFEKCPFYCSSTSHLTDKPNEVEDLRSYCLLDLWHKPVTSLSDSGFSSGTVSKDGHIFGCHHETQSFHWVLILDKSGSMHPWSVGDINPWKDVEESTISFMTSRGSVSTADKYSIIIYDHDAYIEREFEDVTNFDARYLSNMKAGGGTDFGIALYTADRLISRHLDGACTPVLVFMSDGGSSNGDAEMIEIARKYKVEHKLKVYTIGFGRVNFSKLELLANLGGGKFIECTEGIDLKHTFIQIASDAPANVGVTSCK